MELIHGGDVYSTENLRVDFSANINPLGMPDPVKAAAIASLSQCGCYPDPLCRKLRSALSEKEQLPMDWIVCGNGAADVIFRLALAVKPKKALVLAPAFAEYEQALSAVECEIHHHFLLAENDFNVTDSILKELSTGIDLVFLCNPNNPTGQVIAPPLLERILMKCRACGILLVLDECFNDFLDKPEIHTLKGKLGKFPNLLILKAFTKIYAMAGLRLGYGLCSDQALLERIFSAGQPWSVSIPAQEAGVQALKETEYLRCTAELIPAERQWLKSELEKQGFRVLGSKANYLFFKAYRNLKEKLLKKGILIRSCENYPGLDGTYYRVAVRTREENRLLAEALEDCGHE